MVAFPELCDTVVFRLAWPFNSDILLPFGAKVLVVVFNQQNLAAKGGYEFRNERIRGKRVFRIVLRRSLEKRPFFLPYQLSLDEVFGLWRQMRLYCHVIRPADRQIDLVVLEAK